MSRMDDFPPIKLKPEDLERARMFQKQTQETMDKFNIPEHLLVENNCRRTIVKKENRMQSFGKTMAMILGIAGLVMAAVLFVVNSEANGQTIPQLEPKQNIPVSRICYARVRCSDVDPGDNIYECMDNLGIVYTRCMSTCEECFMDDQGYDLCAMGCFLDANGDYATFPPLDGCMQTVCDEVHDQ